MSLSVAIAATDAVEAYHLARSDYWAANDAMVALVGGEQFATQAGRLSRWPDIPGTLPAVEPLRRLGDAAAIARRIDPAMMIPLDPVEACLAICYRALAKALPDQGFGIHWPDRVWNSAAAIMAAIPHFSGDDAMRQRLIDAVATIIQKGESDENHNPQQ